MRREGKEVRFRNDGYGGRAWQNSDENVDHSEMSGRPTFVVVGEEKKLRLLARQLVRLFSNGKKDWPLGDLCLYGRGKKTEMYIRLPIRHSIKMGVGEDWFELPNSFFERVCTSIAYRIKWSKLEVGGGI